MTAGMIALLFAITALSLVGGTVAGLIAWRTVRDNRQRSAARIARLAEVIHAAEPREGAEVRTSHLLDAVDVEGGRRRRVAAAAAGVAVAAAVLAGIGLNRANSHPSAAQASTPPQAQPGPSPRTLELVSLVHERGPAGTLELHGEVHNPDRSATLDGVTAVAMLFDGQGAYLASGRAPLEAGTRARGDAASFSITIPGADAAARYRVSFRTNDRIVPHTDRRHNH